MKLRIFGTGKNTHLSQGKGGRKRRPFVRKPPKPVKGGK